MKMFILSAMALVFTSMAWAGPAKGKAPLPGSPSAHAKHHLVKHTTGKDKAPAKQQKKAEKNS